MNQSELMNQSVGKIDELDINISAIKSSSKRNKGREIGSIAGLTDYNHKENNESCSKFGSSEK